MSYRNKRGHRSQNKSKYKGEYGNNFDSTYKFYGNGYYPLRKVCCYCGHEFDCHRYLVCPRCGMYRDAPAQFDDFGCYGRFDGHGFGYDGCGPEFGYEPYGCKPEFEPGPYGFYPGNRFEW